MSKLYIFAIGGTGSRVLRSLTMLFTAGVKSTSDEIIPIIIDPDFAAADLTRTVELMQTYSKVRKSLTFSSDTKNHFLETQIMEEVPNFRMTIKNGEGRPFSSYIEINGLSRENEALIRALFSDDNLDSDMQVGFKGNPNIGSIVLNQFAESKEFNAFASNFQEGDKIFIVSSIFGGTGASGFPLLLKTIRGFSGPNKALLQSAPIGAISVLPYFGLEQDKNSKIDSTTFIAKTRAALSYYNANISGNNSVDNLYYIADDIKNCYSNSEGGVTQQNAAHLIELLAATAVLHFDANSVQQQHTSSSPTHTYEFGTNEAADAYQFTDFHPVTRKLLSAPLTRLMIFSRYCREVLSNAIGKQPWSKTLSLDDTFFSSPFATDIRKLTDAYFDWLIELRNNNRSFAPFELDAKNPEASVRGLQPHYGFLKFSKGFDLINDELNKASNHVSSDGSSRQQAFADIAFLATNNIVTQNLNM